METHEAPEEETPWLAFSDAMTALLFVFIATTFWFLFRLEQAIEAQNDEVTRLRGADIAAGKLLQGVEVCLKEPRGNGVRVRPVVEESSRTMSLYIEPRADTIVEWFQVCSAEITDEAATVVRMARDCLAAEVPGLTKDYTVMLTLEGHTDARAPAASCRERFPSNWELSGARAGAALRRLMCEDGSCGPEAEVKAAILREQAQDRERLQLVAAGRAESVPSWRALCDPAWPGAAVDTAFDELVCGLLGGGGLRGSSANQQPLVSAVRDSLSPITANGVATYDEALVAWANDPRCSTVAADRASCEERFRRLRRVDMRVDLRPRIEQ